MSGKLPPTKEEYPICDENDYQKIQKLLQEKQTGFYQLNYISKLLHEKDTIRKTFLAIVKTDPSRISEVSEETLLTKPTCYSSLHKLMEMKLIERVYALSVINGEIKNDSIKEKFEKWTNNMPETVKRYYLAKTSYFLVTDFGKKFAIQAYKFEQEFRQKEIKTFNSRPSNEEIGGEGLASRILKRKQVREEMKDE